MNKVTIKKIDLKTGKTKTVIPVRDDNTANICTFKRKLVVEEMPF